MHVLTAQVTKFAVRSFIFVCGILLVHGRVVGFGGEVFNFLGVFAKARDGSLLYIGYSKGFRRGNIVNTLTLY